MDAQLKIVLVEDNDDLRYLLTRDIQRAGFMIQSAESSDDLDELAAKTKFDLLILDLSLPGEDGLSIARRYRRANPNIFIIMLTARGSEQDKIIGYETGADVYLTKPVSSAELTAAIGSVSRRLNQFIDHDSIVSLNVRAMSLEGKKRVDLNQQEVVLLKALIESPSGNLPYYRLLELSGEEEVTDLTKAALEVRIVRLRKKLLDAGLDGKAIRAIRGEGYQLSALIKLK